ncbi:MAG TPA: hypothetical protein VLL52_18645 [Anaerolineae bacterium]|nr:hypothetical protein [Anaerolineae bacterium]
MAQTVTTAGLEKPENASSGVNKLVNSKAIVTIKATKATRIFSEANNTIAPAKISRTKTTSVVIGVLASITNFNLA